jgi:cytochrome c-type biogenesis protein CcmH/NrfG
MSDVLQQAVIAIKTGDSKLAGQLLSQILQADPSNTTALVWLSRIAGSEEKRRACLERALTLNSFLK